MDRGYNGKRPHPLYEGDMVERNGRQKRRNQGGFSSHSSSREPHLVPRHLPLPFMAPAMLPDDVVFRILCPSQKIGSVIGKGGSIIKTLRQDSGAKIKIADAIPGVDERVIIISALDRGNERGRGRDRDRGDSRDRGRDGRSRERDGGKDEDRKERESSHRDGEKLSASQEALFKVHARIVADVESSGGGASDHEEDPSQQVATRLLVPNNQIGCLLGKGGKIIEQMRQSTGAQIRVLPKDQLPGCAMATDEIVQVSGDAPVVKKALLSISSRLQDNPPRDRPPSFASRAPAFVPVNDYLPPPRDSYRSKSDGHLMGLGPEHLDRDPWAMRGGNLPLDRLDDRRRKEGRDSAENELMFRLLCPSDKIGSVIGKGGSIIYNLRKETGARIKIANVVPGSDERVIIVSAFELPGDSFSPALEAMIQVQSRITAEMGGDKDGIVTTRLLVPTNQIGCLLGKGGSIIEDMRRATRANIRVLPKDNLPRCAIDTDELVQIVGDTTVAREALFQVISRLRNNAFREIVSEPVRGGGGGRDYGHSLPSLSLSGENYSSSYDFGGRMGSRSPRGGVYSMSGMHSSSGFGRPSSPPEVWSMGGGGGLSSLSGFGGGPSHLIQPLDRFGGGGNRVITSHGHGTSLGTMSTIEVHIPNSAVGSVIGKGGSNIAEISGAKVKLHSNEQGAKDRVLELSGTQEQTHAAQSLIQAYMQSSTGGGGLHSSLGLPPDAVQ